MLSCSTRDTQMMAIPTIVEQNPWESRSCKVSWPARQTSIVASKVFYKLRIYSNRLRKILPYEVKIIDTQIASKAGSGLSKMRHSSLKIIQRLHLS